jgi:hypothetical protein
MSNGEIILYTTEDGKASIQFRIENKSVWLTQLELAELFQTSEQNISLHIKNILEERELDDSVVKSFLTTAADGKRQWGRLDSNQRIPKERDLQSLAIAAMRRPLMMLAKGIEPSTIRLQVGRSAN